MISDSDGDDGDHGDADDDDDDDHHHHHAVCRLPPSNPLNLDGAVFVHSL